MLLNRIKLAYNSLSLSNETNNCGRVIFLLSEARTGSGLLSGYLNSLPGVNIGGEVLNPLVGSGLPLSSSRFTIHHLNVSLKNLAQGNTYGGVKLHLKHCQWHGLTIEKLYTNFSNAIYLILYRENFAAQYVSRANAPKCDLGFKV
jgi:hypothetical protein